MLKKYLSLTNTYLQNSLAYPTRIIGSLFGTFTIILVFLILWSAVFENQDTLFGYSFDKIVLYYTVTYLIRPVTVSGNSTSKIANEIKMGTFSFLLIKPISISGYFLTKSRTENFIKIILPLFVLAAVTVLFNKNFLTPFWIICFAASLILSSIINHFVYSTLGVLAFYTKEINGVKHIFGRISDILSGGVFPLDFLPPTIFVLVSFLPFKYMNFTTVSTYLLNYSKTEALVNILIQLLWILGSFLIYIFFFNKGIKQYESVGA